MKLLCRPLFLLLCWISICQVGFAGEKPWIEVRSPHFRLITNGSESAGRHMARQFELIRAVFATQFPGFQLEGNEPLLILAPRDKEITNGIRIPENIAGLYHHGWERDFAVVRLDAVTSDVRNPDTYAVVYHEYVHSLLHVNFRWIPSWLDEGLAEFYGYTRFEGDKMYIGAPPRNRGRLDILYKKVTPPLATFITTRRFYQSNHEDLGMSYAQGWALVHFLTFGPGMGNGQRLKQFFNALQRGVEQKKAFEETFGSFEEIQKQYDSYIFNVSFGTGILPAPEHLQEKDFAARQMSPAETEAELAAYAIRLHSWEPVHQLGQAAVDHDPKLSLGHEDLAFWYYNEGKDEDALKEFSKAVDLDPKAHVSLFAKTMISASNQTSPLNPTEKERALMTVLDLKPNFAPAFVELSKFYLANGDMARALGLSRKAEQLEPLRAGYHLLSGEILLRTGRASDAASTAAYVADRWGGVDHDDAIDLWNRIPAAQRGDAHLLEDAAIKSPKDQLNVAEGVVKSVSCHDRSFAITLDKDGESLTFRSEGFPVGFSDTLWVGRDHFSPCFHVNGLRVIVRYKPSSDKSYAGDLSYAGFRDDLQSRSNTVTAATGKN
jgi:tetratricopeptide (TPR) repeat protein